MIEDMNTDDFLDPDDPQAAKLRYELGKIAALETRQDTLRNAYEDVRAECEAQIEKWGVQNHPTIYEQMVGDMSPTARYAIPSELRWKNQYELDLLHKQTNWGTILMEEVAEAITAASRRDNAEQTYQELIQVAAVALQAAANVSERIQEIDTEHEPTP
jgi:hypothetical protein